MAFDIPISMSCPQCGQPYHGLSMNDEWICLNCSNISVDEAISKGLFAPNSFSTTAMEEVNSSSSSSDDPFQLEPLAQQPLSALMPLDDPFQLEPLAQQPLDDPFQLELLAQQPPSAPRLPDDIFSNLGSFPFPTITMTGGDSSSSSSSNASSPPAPLKTHTRSKQYTCNTCKKPFAQWSRLCQHKQSCRTYYGARQQSFAEQYQHDQHAPKTLPTTAMERDVSSSSSSEKSTIHCSSCHTFSSDQLDELVAHALNCCNGTGLSFKKLTYAHSNNAACPYYKADRITRCVCLITTGYRGHLQSKHIEPPPQQPSLVPKQVLCSCGDSFLTYDANLLITHVLKECNIHKELELASLIDAKRKNAACLYYKDSGQPCYSRINSSYKIHLKKVHGMSL